MKYPSDFPSESRARVEAEKIRGSRDFEGAKESTRWVSEVEALLRHYILRTFLAFVEEAQTRRLWTVEDMDWQCRDFLRLLTIDAYHEKGYDRSGGRLCAMTSNWNGAILPEVQRKYEETPAWLRYQDALLEVAQAQIGEENQHSSARRNKTVIGQNIDRLRKECEWSFNKLAERTGLEKTLILGHVNKGKGMRPTTLKMYADAFTKELKRVVSVAELKS